MLLAMPHKSILAGEKSLRALGAAVRATRKERGLSQEDLAVDAEVERSYLGAIERAEVNVTIVVVARICSALKIKPSELFARAGL
jgi:transcriptional regulator with XRE-family HTH domain